MSTQGTWDKAKGIMKKLTEAQALAARVSINHKEKEQDVGFLFHISRTYSKLFPYLKGFNNTLNSLHEDRDNDSLKVTSKTALVELASMGKDEDSRAFLSSSGDQLRKYGKEEVMKAPSEVQMV